MALCFLLSFSYNSFHCFSKRCFLCRFTTFCESLLNIFGCCFPKRTYCPLFLHLSNCFLNKLFCHKKTPVLWTEVLPLITCSIEQVSFRCQYVLLIHTWDTCCLLLLWRLTRWRKTRLLHSWKLLRLSLLWLLRSLSLYLLIS